MPVFLCYKCNSFACSFSNSSSHGDNPITNAFPNSDDACSDSFVHSYNTSSDACSDGDDTVTNSF
eukprot:UN04632